MDVHQQLQLQQQQQQQYPQSDAQAPFYGVSSYDLYYDPYSQSHYDASAYSYPYYDHPHPHPYPYHQPPPPGVDPTQNQYAMPPLNEGMEAATYSHSSEFEVPMNANGDGAQGGVDRDSFRGQNGRRGGRGGIGRRNFRGRDHGRGGGRGQEPAQPPQPKPAREPKQPAWCDICRVGCTSIEILEQHKAGKRHKRTVQRIQEYEAQQKQLAGYQSTVVISATTEVGPSVAEIVHQTLPEPVAASASSVTHEAGASYLSDKGEIPVERNKKSEAQNQLVPEAPSECVRTEAGGTQATPPSETSQEEAATSGKRPFIKRPRPDGYGLGSMGSYCGVARFDQGGRRGGRFEHGSKRPRRFGGDFQSWAPMPMPMMPPYSMMPSMPMPGLASPIQRVRPVVCTVCNVTCDTPSVFDTHVSGKKHRLRISRVMVCSNMVFGPITVFIPPGQPSPYPNGLEPVFYGITTPELIKQHEMLMRNQMEDKCEEEVDVGEGDQQDRNPKERAEGDIQEEAMLNTETNGVRTNAEQGKDGNGSATEPTSATVCISSRNEYQGTGVATNDSDVVPGLQTTTDVAEEVTGEGVVG